MNHQSILECLHLSLESRIAFPDLVRRLLDAGVDSYEVDLNKARIVFYDVYNQSIDLPFGVDDIPPVGESFDAEAVAQAVKRSQIREIAYSTFIREIAKAGTSDYTVYLNDSRVVYRGGGGSHEEPFPPVRKVL